MLSAPSPTENFSLMINTAVGYLHNFRCAVRALKPQEATAELLGKTCQTDVCIATPVHRSRLQGHWEPPLKSHHQRVLR